MITEDKMQTLVQVSVIIPTFNNIESLFLLIKSLENQSFKNFEVIVVDDGSTYDVNKIIADLRLKTSIDFRYFYLDNTNFFGAGAARNYGAKQANSEILVFLDQDMISDINLIKNHFLAQATNDVVLGYIAAYGNKKYKYDLFKLKKYVLKNKIIETVIPDFRDRIFNQQNIDLPWKYFCSGNFSMKKVLFLNILFDENIKKWGGQDIEFGYRINKNNNSIYFFKKAICFNNSNERMLSSSKFVSSMSVLKYFYEKHKDPLIIDYVFERFIHTSFSLRSNSKLTFENNNFIFSPPNKLAFIRIDDVFEKEPNIMRILDYLINHEIPSNLQIIPDLLLNDMKIYLAKLKQKYPHLLFFNQHGFNHENHNPNIFPKYEFGDSRTYEEQKKDIKEGFNVMKKSFDKNFYEIFTPPFYGCNENTIKILKELKFKAISVNSKFVQDNSILLNINVNLDPIKKYNPDEFYTQKELFTKIDNIFKKESLIGLVLHPKRFNLKELNKLESVISYIDSKVDYFSSMEKIIFNS